MESGNIVEFIDRQKIVCAVVMDIKEQRIRLLTENNREVKLSVGRLLHKSDKRLPLSLGRDKLIESMKAISEKRRLLAEKVNLQELWETVNSEQEWIDLPTMTALCFPEDQNPDNESAVIRAFFQDRIYFKFSTDAFFPNTLEQVEQIQQKARDEAHKIRIIEEGSVWLKHILADENCVLSQDRAELVEVIKSLYLFEKQSPHYEIGKALLDKAGIKNTDSLFDLLVKLNVWSKDENIDLYHYEIPVLFSDEIMKHSAELIKIHSSLSSPSLNSGRKDLTDLSIITIDGQATLDFDDALSIEDKDGNYRLGVHIADVGYLIKQGDIIDREAVIRGSSIYLPDQKIPMLPPCLAEDICSLKAGELRPAISIMITLTKSADILHYEIIPSIIRVTHQLTYHEVNQITEENKDICKLYEIAKQFRQKRLSNGAVQISLPEINIWVSEDGELILNRTNRETPSRILVSEIMIMANWLTAKFLTERGISAIFRSQPPPKDRLYEKDEGTLFQNWMQRKLLSRFVLGCEPEQHSGLGLDSYLTATSPIRKYSDLITQRQIRAALGFGQHYTSQDIENTIHMLEQPMMKVAKIQYWRKRYWLLKYLENRIGQQEEGIILIRRKNSYITLMPEYLIECEVHASGTNLRPEDHVNLTIHNVNARKDTISVCLS